MTNPIHDIAFDPAGRGDPAHEALESAISEHIVLPPMSEREHSLSAFSIGLQRWLLSLDFSAPENEINVKTVYRKATPERAYPIMLVYYWHGTKLIGSYKVSLQDPAHATQTPA